MSQCIVCLKSLTFSAVRVCPNYPLGMALITNSIFYQFQPKPMTLLYLKSENHIFFWFTPFEHLPMYKDTKGFNDFFQISGWLINPAIWLDNRICCDNLWTRNMWWLFSFLFVFHSMLFSVKLQLSDTLWTHVDLWTYLGMPDYFIRNIRLYVFNFWLSSKYKQSMRLIHSIQRYIWQNNPTIWLIESFSFYQL